jgi:hypothetical protein
MIREALDTIVINYARSRGKAHELCYRFLRERHPHLHNKFVQEAYKRALAMYRSYRKLLNRWRRLPEEKREKCLNPRHPVSRIIGLWSST